MLPTAVTFRIQVQWRAMESIETIGTLGQISDRVSKCHKNLFKIMIRPAYDLYAPHIAALFTFYESLIFKHLHVIRARSATCVQAPLKYLLSSLSEVSGRLLRALFAPSRLLAVSLASPSGSPPGSRLVNRSGVPRQHLPYVLRRLSSMSVLDHSETADRLRRTQYVQIMQF